MGHNETEKTLASLLADLRAECQNKVDNKLARIKNLPSDLVKARSIAGFILGSSRHHKDSDLEVAVKRQFMMDKFDLQSLSKAVDNSRIPADVARRAKELISSY